NKCSARSKWFTREWTLRELIAPRALVFLSQDWTVIGKRRNSSEVVEQITGVDQAISHIARPLTRSALQDGCHGLPSGRLPEWTTKRTRSWASSTSTCRPSTGRAVERSRAFRRRFSSASPT
ncbi:hypothetical protein L226DRAFT_604824, partial [Lentinus tigrinus ALCF2SS1-7]|uniref:uncharacterized protein n=1 Tax=Lentinus tigrinus ALCF2SS1-7 TaxID=1328758 RepID=UPI001165DC3B